MGEKTGRRVNRMGGKLRFACGRTLGHSDGVFEARWWAIEMLDVRVALAIEDGENVAHLRCVLGDDSLSLGRTNTYTGLHNEQNGIVLTAKVILPY